MITIRRGDERGRGQFDWLDSRHTFSFADYYDPRHMGFRALRVINEDVIAPGAGFPTHPHRDMEIITYVLDGAVEHRDTLGTREVVKAGEVQRMTAGTGIRHSEFNASKTEPLHLLQIWLLPGARNLAPAYEQRELPPLGDELALVAAPEGGGGALTINQDARLYAGRLRAGAETSHRLARGRGAWLQVARGEIEIDGEILAAGDGAAIENEDTVTLTATTDAEVLLFDLA